MRWISTTFGVCILCYFSCFGLTPKCYALKVYKKLPPTCQIKYLKGLGPGFQLLESYLLLVYLLFGEKEETIIIGRMGFWALSAFRGSPCLEKFAFYVLEGKGG